jgi:hypothetical protein
MTLEELSGEPVVSSGIRLSPAGNNTQAQKPIILQVKFARLHQENKYKNNRNGVSYYFGSRFWTEYCSYECEKRPRHQPEHHSATQPVQHAQQATTQPQRTIVPPPAGD